ncbi:hypothetical protein BDF21DRAFT_350186 [Thamnidium elegans]|nr:hypothetical protein BDF21DRAFT_350186 [Thamnidium elegans]
MVILQFSFSSIQWQNYLYSYSITDEQLKAFTLPMNWKSDADLVNKHFPENLYTVAQIEWADTEGLFIMYYSSQNENDERYAPVVVTVQKEISQTSMLKIIRYCTFVYEKYNLLPTVLIISSSSRLDTRVDSDIDMNVDSSFKLIKSDCWARECLLFLPDSISTTLNNKSTNTLIALCQYISNPNKILSFSSNSPFEL